MHTAQSPQEFSTTVFDYIVIGGGNGGFPLAIRLAENPRVKVGVLEAGPMPSDDPLVTQPRFIGRATGTAFDWGFKSDPQLHANQRSFPLPRGKGLAGSTMINYLVWDRASKAEYDDWKRLADKEGAWDWDSLLPYFKKTEDASPTKDTPDPYPTMSLSDANVERPGLPAEEAIGWDGPVKTTYNTLYTDVIAPSIKAFNSVGVPTNANPYGGETDGIHNLRRTIDKASGKRINAASAYLGLAAQSDNLHILTSAMVTKVVFDASPDASGNYVASGAEFSVNGEKYVVSATKEVILSAGALQTPQLLELSGIGKAELLKAHDIPCLIDLPGVGENLIDHIFAPIQFLLRPGTKTFDEFRINPEFMAEQTAKYESTGQGWLAAFDSTAVFNPLHRVTGETEFASFIEKLKDSIAKAREDKTLTPLQEEQYKIQLEWLDKETIPNLETIIFSKGLVMPMEGRSYFIMQTGIQHPFSRGSVHIGSADPLQLPNVNPNYLSNDFDIELLVAGFRFMEKVSGTSHLKEIIETHTVPPVPLTEKEALVDFLRMAFSSGAHLMGTAALARRELGGIVDNNLKVYGTSNLRIADASIIPIPIAGHIQATVYAIGEKAADLIKASHNT